MTVASVALAAGPAEATMGKGRIQLCSRGSYPSWIAFVHQNAEFGGMNLVKPGTCAEGDIMQSTDTIRVWAQFNGYPALSIYQFAASPQTNPGLKVYTYGDNVLNYACRVAV
jgi:hypothetical protein